MSDWKRKMLVWPPANAKFLQPWWIHKSYREGPAASVTQEAPSSHVFWAAHPPTPFKVLSQVFYSNWTWNKLRLRKWKIFFIECYFSKLKVVLFCKFQSSDIWVNNSLLQSLNQITGFSLSSLGWKCTISSLLASLLQNPKEEEKVHRFP